MATKKKPAKKAGATKTKLDLHESKFSGSSDQTGLRSQTFDPMMLTSDMVNTLINSDVKKPSWKGNKYPVAPDEFKKLQAKAAQLDKATAMALSASTEADGDSDSAMELAATQLQDELPEDAFGSFAPAGNAPSVSSTFEAIPSTGWIPPDCVVATNGQEVVACVNSEFRVYSSTGTLLRRNVYGSFFTPVLPNSAAIKIFDPRIIYDHYNNRFVMIVAATQSAPAKSWCGIAVSKTNDPNGAWWLWALDAAVDGSSPTQNWMDYPMLGFDAKAIYIGMNMFKGNAFQYCKVRILNKTELYSGSAVRWFDFWNLKNPDGSLAFTVQPCCHFRGNTAGPGYMISNHFGANNKLTMWTINNPLALWSGGAPTMSKVSIACRNYDIPPQAKQKGSATTINTNDNRLLNAVYQHTGNIKRIWAAHNSKASWAGDTEARSVCQWYEVDVVTNAVSQSNFFGLKGYYYMFPVIQTDLARNAYMVFSRCGETEFANLRLTGRRVTDAAGQMDGSTLIKAGESAHLSGRYGDYFGIGRNGTDQNSIVAIGEYAESGGNWGTYVVRSRY